MIKTDNFFDKAQCICNIYKDLPLASRNTFKIESHAKFAAFPKNEQELCSILPLAKAHGIKARVLGNGSNVLFSSRGISGLTVFTSEMNEISVCGNTVLAECGAKLSALCRAAQKNGLCGAEFAFGIPGSVGGAVYMNAGAYGGEISDILIESTCFDTENEQIVKLSAKEHEFAYRSSIFQKGKLIVLSSLFRFTPGNALEAEKKMKEYSEKRKASQPLNYPNAGSIFKRPAVGFSGKYIEDAGLKGFTVGGAQVSEKHAGFIVNIGGATSDDVLTLINKIKDEIFCKFGVKLETEIIYIE